jgi:hypothetical protein
MKFDLFFLVSQSEAGRKAPFILVINLQVLLISDPACSDDCQMSKG